MEVTAIVPLDLTIQGENDHDHPDISPVKQYLARINGTYLAGQFVKQWFGWYFQPVLGASGFQYDRPGTNHSKWEALWEIVTAPVVESEDNDG